MNRVAIGRFGESCDWSRTRAFAIPDSFVGMIRVNLAGREPAGIVAPGADYERTLSELEADLLALRDPRTGRPAIEKVARMRAADGGPPPRCPDLVAAFEAHEPPLLRLEHPRAVIRQADPWWAAENGHSGRGLVVSSDPSGPLARVPVRCVEVAPAIVSLMGSAAGSTV